MKNYKNKKKIVSLRSAKKQVVASVQKNNISIKELKVKIAEVTSVMTPVSYEFLYW